MIDGVLPFQDDLRNGDKRIALLQQVLDNTRQCRRGIFCRVVEQNDAAGLDLGGYSLRNIGGRKVLLIQAVTIPYKGKSFRHNTSGLFEF